MMFLTLHIYTILVSISMCFTCMSDYKDRDFTCRVNVKNNIVLSFKMNQSRVSSSSTQQTSHLYLLAEKSYGRRENEEAEKFKCKQRVRDATAVVVCEAWNLEELSEYTNSVNAYTMALVALTTANQTSSTKKATNQIASTMESFTNLKHLSGNSSSPLLLVWEDRELYRPNQYSCNCKGYYGLNEVNGTTSYEEITLTWKVRPWMFYENYRLHYHTTDNDSVNVTTSVHKMCSHGACAAKVTHLRQCTRYKLCVSIKNTRDCVEMRTKCVAVHDRLLGVTRGKSSTLHVEMKISLGAMGGLFLITCLIVALMRWKRKPPRQVVEQLIEPRGSCNDDDLELSQRCSTSTQLTYDGYCDIPTYVDIPIDGNNSGDTSYDESVT